VDLKPWSLVCVMSIHILFEKTERSLSEFFLYSFGYVLFQPRLMWVVSLIWVTTQYKLYCVFRVGITLSFSWTRMVLRLHFSSSSSSKSWPSLGFTVTLLYFTLNLHSIVWSLFACLPHMLLFLLFRHHWSLGSLFKSMSRQLKQVCVMYGSCDGREDSAINWLESGREALFKSCVSIHLLTLSSHVFYMVLLDKHLRMPLKRERELKTFFKTRARGSLFCHTLFFSLSCLKRAERLSSCSWGGEKVKTRKRVSKQCSSRGELEGKKSLRGSGLNKF